jgi:hypothetical protein
MQLFEKFVSHKAIDLDNAAETLGYFSLNCINGVLNSPANKRLDTIIKPINIA